MLEPRIVPRDGIRRVRLVRRVGPENHGFILRRVSLGLLGELGVLGVRVPMASTSWMLRTSGSVPWALG